MPRAGETGRGGPGSLPMLGGGGRPVRGVIRAFAGFGARAGAIDIDAEGRVIGAVLLEFAPIAGGERQAVAVVDSALGDLAHDGLQARIVLVAAPAIGLYHQRARANGGAAAENLDVGGFGDDDGGGDS